MTSPGDNYPTMSNSDDNNSSSTCILADPSDICLQVPLEAGYKNIRVSSTVLCLASKVFTGMLGANSKFREAQLVGVGREDAFVALHDDNYDALLTILRVIHMQTTLVPLTNTVDNIYQIAVLCDKYEIAAPLVPWIQLWTSSLLKDMPTSDSIKWLFISWVFRKPRMFQRFSKDLISASVLNDDLILMTDQGEMYPDVIPERLIKAITRQRRVFLHALQTICVAEFETYCRYKLQGKNRCQLRDKKNDCDAMGVGIMLRFLMSSGMWPKLEYPNSQSIRLALGKIDTIEDFGAQITFFQQGRSHNEGNHVGCGPKGRLHLAATQAGILNIKGLEITEFYAKEDIFFSGELKPMKDTESV